MFVKVPSLVTKSKKILLPATSPAHKHRKLECPSTKGGDN